MQFRVIFIALSLFSTSLNACVFTLAQLPTFLLQNHYPGAQDPIFLEKMGSGIQAVSRAIRIKIKNNSKFTEKDIYMYMDYLAQLRNQVARARKLPHAELYGLKMPRRWSEIEPFELRLRNWVATHPKTANYDPATDSFYVEAAESRYFFQPEGLKIDLYTPNLMAIIRETGRHAKYYREAVAALKERGETGVFHGYNKDWNNTNPPWSQLSYLKSLKEMRLSHPNLVSQMVHRQIGIQILLDRLNNRGYDRNKTYDHIAGFSFRMMHAPPYFMGSPSVIESLDEGVLIELHQTGFPSNKTREPFWKINFWNSEAEEFRADQLLHCFQ